MFIFFATTTWAKIIASDFTLFRLFPLANRSSIFFSDELLSSALPYYLRIFLAALIQSPFLGIKIDLIEAEAFF